MNKEGQFKSKLLGGFNRRDVLQYIETLQKKDIDKTNEYERLIDQLCREKDLMANEIYEKDELIKSLQQIHAKNNNELNEFRINLDATQDELNRYKTLLRKKEYDLNVAGEKNKQLGLKLESHILKSKRYDELNEKIGEAMTEAHRQSELIINHAHTEARKIMHQAKNAMTDISNRSFYFKEEITNLRKQIDRFSLDISEYVDGLDKEITKTIDSLNYNDKDMCDNIASHAKKESDEERKHIEKIRKSEKIVTYRLRSLEDTNKTNTQNDKFSFNNEFSLDDDNNLFRFAAE